MTRRDVHKANIASARAHACVRKRGRALLKFTAARKPVEFAWSEDDNLVGISNGMCVRVCACVRDETNSV